MDLSNETDAQLTARMGRKSDPDGSRAAWGELYRRHFKFLYGVCFRAARVGDRHERARDLATDAFRRAYEAPGNFAMPEGTPAEDASRIVRAWLGRIAANLLRDEYRRGGPDGDDEPMSLDQLGWRDVPQTEPSPPSSRTAEAFRVMSEVLDDRERDVLVTTFEWHVPGRIHQRLPNAVLQALADRWKTTPAAIRQVRKRALAKIEEALRTGAGSAPAEREDR